jgi:hypothetical protein
MGEAHRRRRLSVERVDPGRVHMGIIVDKFLLQ